MTQCDGGPEDLFGGLEDQGCCFACGELGHKVVHCPFQKERKVLPAPSKRGGGAAILRGKPGTRCRLQHWRGKYCPPPVPENERDQWSRWNPDPSRIRWDGERENPFGDLEQQG
ncbi:UNVERIFIED_CONTAM: hypothetical protein FKN15_034094 [Acipenser sinensis]